MAHWSPTDGSEYRETKLRAHAVVAGMPLHDVWRLDLPGGGDGRGVADVRSLMLALEPGAPTRFLFALRWLLGRWFGWDRESGTGDGALRDRLDGRDQARSQVPSGTRDGPFTVLYVFDHEAISEVRNSTVHAAVVTVLLPKDDGYRMLWAIHVEPVGRLTSFYMALIGPFRRFIVYPSMLRSLRREWCRQYGGSIS